MAYSEAPTHIVAVSGLVRNATGDVLMVLSPLRGWEMSGGRVEAGETLPDALMREIREEAGVTVSVGALVSVYSNVKPPTKVILGFLCEYVSGALTTSEESLETTWMKPDEALARITHPAIADRMRDLLNFSGQVVYRAYTTDPYTVVNERRF